MNDERFFDLAMKSLGRNCTEQESRELDALVSAHPELRVKLEKLQADARLAREVAPLIAAASESPPVRLRATTLPSEAVTRSAAQPEHAELPAYARGRLQTKVRQTLGRPSEEKSQSRGLAWGWRWPLGLAAVTVLLIFALPMFRTPNAPVIQVAMLDTTGGTRGTDTNQLALLKDTWKGIPIQNFSIASELETWEKSWPSAGAQPVAKIIYDPAAGEVRVLGYSKGKAFQKSFPVNNDLPAVLQQVSTFVHEQVSK